MAVTKGKQRKLVEFFWEKENLRGGSVSIEARPNPDAGEVGGDFVEKKTGPNDGMAEFAFPLEYTGVVEVRVADSHGNAETGPVRID